MRAATQAEADALALHLCRRFHARLVRKDMAFEMQLIAAGLDALRVLGVGVPVGGDFLDHYATTIGPLIYLPPGWHPDAQIEVLTHEVAHVAQFWKGGGQAQLAAGPGMGWLYLVEGEARVRYEVEAYRAGLEVAYRRTRQLPALDALVMPLEGGYALGAPDLALARELLERAATSVAAGVVSTEAGAEAIGWLDRHAPELLA